jgi:phosphoribosyl-AMP cyclohydrolase
LNQINIDSIDFKKGNGLVPVVVQDFNTLDILMLAYANKEAVQKTIDTGYGHYWSRSRKKIWKKGETSGHLQKVNKILLDCDNDTLLYMVEQTGVACHTGEKTCFHNKLK